MSTDCSTATCISIINSNLFERPFDCVSVAPDTIAITDLSKDDGKVHIIDANKNCIAYSLNELTIPAGFCMLGNIIIIITIIIIIIIVVFFHTMHLFYVIGGLLFS